MLNVNLSTQIYHTCIMFYTPQLSANYNKKNNNNYIVYRVNIIGYMVNIYQFLSFSHPGRSEDVIWSPSEYLHVQEC